MDHLALRHATNCAALEALRISLLDQAIDVHVSGEIFDRRRQIHSTLLAEHPSITDVLLTLAGRQLRIGEL